MWNKQIESFVIKTGNMAAMHMHLHEHASKLWGNLSKAISLLAILLNTTISCSAIFGDVNNKPVLQLTQNILIYFGTLLSVFVKFSNYDERCVLHKTFAKQYSELYHLVQNQMLLERNDRTSANEFIEQIIKCFDDLSISSPDIPMYIHSKYNKYEEMLRVLNLNDPYSVNVEKVSNEINVYGTKNFSLVPNIVKLKIKQNKNTNTIATQTDNLVCID
jgi:hypothetical protein